MRSYEEEYERKKYSQPYIGERVTGFSGIDPTLSDEEIRRIILAGLANMQVKLDSGEIA